MKNIIVQRQNKVFKKLDNEIIIYDSEANYVYHLNKTATVILEYCESENNIDKIIDMYSKRFNISKDIADKDVKECIGTLLEKGIISYRENGISEESSEFPKPQIQKRIQ